MTNPETVRLPSGQLVSGPPPQIIRARAYAYPSSGTARNLARRPPINCSRSHDRSSDPVARQPWMEPVTLRRAADSRDPGRIACSVSPAARGATSSTPREFGERERASRPAPGARHGGSPSRTSRHHVWRWLARIVTQYCAQVNRRIWILVHLQGYTAGARDTLDDANSRPSWVRGVGHGLLSCSFKTAKREKSSSTFRNGRN